MDTSKKQRTVHRTLFTKSLNNFIAKCNNATVPFEDRQVALQMLESRMQDLELANSKYVDFLSETATEEDIVTDMEAQDKYKEKFLEAKLRFIGQITTNSRQETNGQPSTQTEKPFKRPFLKVVKYSGSVSTWLQFWSHFRKIHEDRSVSQEDKLEYLKQMMEEGSKAESVVNGFPTTAENYDKAFESLKNRFGRDDLLIEFYTRELLSLALQNATNKGKQVDVSTIYDKISAHIRALETLGVKTDNCATMLYPLVESSLPEEILRTWQRSAFSTSNEPVDGGEVPDRLTRLLQFLKAEVSNEERINMAISGFTSSTLAEKRSKDSKGKEKTGPLTELPSASVLFSGEERRLKCIFCDGNHENANCDKAKKLSYDERKDLIKQKRCCFKCLKPNHQSSNCRVRISCAFCGNRHSVLMCPSLCNATRNATPSKSETRDRKENVEQSLASFVNMPDVILQTLRVVLYSDSERKVARVVIDQGSHRSYVRSEVAKFMGYEPLGKRAVTHTLFGGANSGSKEHDIYLIRMKSLDGKYSCNFQVMNEDTICTDIPTIKSGPWVKELGKANVSLTDLETTNVSDRNIDVLIGADVAGKLFTGKKRDLPNDLTAFETRLGWVVMGKNPTNDQENCSSTALTMFAGEMGISDLWRLDNFIGRRNRPSVIYSDNGTNFVGANSAFEKLNWDIIAKNSSAKRIQWLFNPPTAAWWGGWWERLIGMVKVILRKVLRKSCLTYDQMYTVLVNCERTINSRPLTYVSDSPDDPKPLTPAMFLNEVRESECPDIDLLRKTDLNRVLRRKQEIIEHLRQRFRTEYLSQLIFKSNVKETRTIKLGDIVLIGDDNRKRIDWPLARIEELIGGRDGTVRVAILKTKDGILKRPIQRIYPLEIERSDINGKDMREVLLNEQTIRDGDNEKNREAQPTYNIENVVRTRSGRIIRKPDYYVSYSVLCLKRFMNVIQRKRIESRTQGGRIRKLGFKHSDCRSIFGVSRFLVFKYTRHADIDGCNFGPDIINKVLFLVYSESSTVL
ncbi:uncharacterized protein LOC143362201 [Halictus rubicundus]|uniref:uncharacterized protein LOC143362201 n=1 Tax=Halictus rubicundus TaxID=77578 RepID=UPI00403641F5